VEDQHFDVAVAGGGPIGLASAWRAAERGLRVAVVDSGAPGAWEVAAGMLAPASEAEYGEGALARLGLRSAERFPSFCAELAAASDLDPGLRAQGTLNVARDRDEAEALDRIRAYRQGLGLAVERLRPSQARRLEPALAPTVRLALDVPGDRSVDPRRMVAALRVAAERAGAVLIRGTAARLLDAGGLQLADGHEVRAGQVLLATGAAALSGEVPVRPVKGQTLRLRDPAGPGLVERTIRGFGVYLVPRADGRYVLGATMEEQGYDRAPTAGGVYELLRDMSEIVPGVLELELEEVRAGLRPATPDNLPAIGPGERPGVVWATVHFRNGILLTAITADLAAAALAGDALPDWAACVDPRRFAGVPV
jgi:glycine oxidase